MHRSILFIRVLALWLQGTISIRNRSDYYVPQVVLPASRPPPNPSKTLSFNESYYPGNIIKVSIFYLISVCILGELFIHLHIPKTGGTAFRSLFNSDNCGYPADGASERAYAIAAEINHNRSSCVFFSHEFKSLTRLYTALGERLDSPAKTLVFFRDPIIHAVSAVGHMLRKRVKGCETISRAALGECKFYNLNNMQTTIVGNRDVDVAISNMKKLFWIGIVEHYDASICLLSYQLGQLNRSACSCSSWLVTPSNRGHPKFTHSYYSIQVGYKNLYLDNILYQDVYKTFLLRIHHAEVKTGHQFLCQKRDGQDAIDLKEYFAATESIEL